MLNVTYMVAIIAMVVVGVYKFSTETNVIMQTEKNRLEDRSICSIASRRRGMMSAKEKGSDLVDQK